MKDNVIGVFMFMLFMTSCAQEPETVLGMSKINEFDMPIDWMPFLTSNGDYIYVNKQLEQQFDFSYWNAEPFLSTGFALVSDNQGRTGVIDTKGNLVVDYSEDIIELDVVGSLTLMRKVREYEKKMMPWSWEWNIMGGSIKKVQTYHKVVISVLESNQLIVSDDVKYDSDNYSLSFQIVDENHVVLNDILYKIKNKKLKKVKKNIASSLDKGRYIPYGESKWDIYSTVSKKPIYANLMETDRLELSLNSELVLLDSINVERYRPDVPKLLVNQENDEVYAFPQYDKPFPKVLNHATKEQLEFLKETSLVYSINNSPYFILGRFNYDHAVWAYDWLYLDVEGNLLDEVKVDDFFMRDRVGYLVWPDKYVLLSNRLLDQNIKFGRIKYVYNSNNLYIVDVKLNEEDCKTGIWNSKTKEWELDPNYYAIQILNTDKHAILLQENEGGKLQIYNHKDKRLVESSDFQAIYFDGRVKFKKENGSIVYFYIDLETGKEYREVESE